MASLRSDEEEVPPMMIPDLWLLYDCAEALPTDMRAAAIAIAAKIFFISCRFLEDCIEL